MEPKEKELLPVAFSIKSFRVATEAELRSATVVSVDCVRAQMSSTIIVPSSSAASFPGPAAASFPAGCSLAPMTVVMVPSSGDAGLSCPGTCLRSFAGFCNPSEWARN